MDREIPNDFYQSEEICGHIVTRETKKLWATQLKCLQELKRICEKHHILYFASGGTLLGAVRHKGFIPWDDDIDVMMFYDDYLKFCEVAPLEIGKPFFFQNYLTEPGFGPSMSRLRNSETTGCTLYDINMFNGSYNCGIFIDIFPLFGVAHGAELFWQRLKCSLYQSIISGYELKRMRVRGNWKLKIKKIIHPKVWLWNVASLFSNHITFSKRFLDACASAKSYKQMGLLSFTGFNSKMIWNKEWFDEMITLPFEFTSIICPKFYEPILRTQYNDYTQFVKGTQIHTMVICDPETPFKEKLDFNHT